LCNIGPDLSRDILAEMGKVLNTEGLAIRKRDPETDQNSTPHCRDKKIAKY